MMKDGQELKRRLAVVDAYRASGQKAKEWAAAHGVGLGELASWCCHANRWRARLDGVVPQSGPTQPVGGFVAARIGAANPSATATVRVELPGASLGLALHWPLSHARELAAWVREVAR
jgi:hypothetical protein